MNNSSAAVQLTFANLVISQIEASLRRTKERLSDEVHECYVYDYEEEEHATIQCEEAIEFIAEIW